MNLILEIFIIFRFSANISLTTPIRGVFAVAVTAILVVSVVAANQGGQPQADIMVEPQQPS